MAEPSTAWAPARPNQQLVAQQRSAARSAGARATREQRLVALGQSMRTVWAGLPRPLLAVQTHFSRLEGTAAPAAWALTLGAWWAEGPAAAPVRRGGNHPGGATAVAQAAALVRAAQVTPLPSASRPSVPDAATTEATGVWAALADRDDLTGLPSTCTAWGRTRVAIGATVRLGAQDVVLLAPTAAAYGRLSLLLTQRLGGGAAAGWWEVLAGTGTAELIVLVQEAAVGARFAAAGARVHWRAGLRPVTGNPPFPPVAVPLLTHLDDDREAAPVLQAIRTRGTVAGSVSGATAAFADLRTLPAAYRGYEDQLTASAALRERAWQQPLDLATGRDSALHLPPMPPDRRHVDSDAELRRLAEAGIPERYGLTPPAAVRARLEHELEVIAGKRFASYILTVHAIVRGRRTCGRGSGASSLVVYLLGITNVDPLRWNLLFDRFLSPERFDPPDLDVDFAWDERDDVFSSILATFGDAHVAMVATHQHLSRHGALREAARAFGLPDAAITAMATRLEERRDFGRDHAGEDATTTLPPPWPAVLAVAARLTGLPRHCGVHCGGVVITVPPLATLVPVHPAAKQVADATVPGTLRAMPTIAWEKDGAEQFGLVKIDILGNRSLAVVRDCLADLAAVGRAPGPEWDPLTDEATRTLLARGDTMGCFYVESPAMRQLQAKVGDGSFDRLVVHSSIIRPAGMAFIRTYIARHHHLRRYGTLTLDEERAWYPHPVLKELLSESYGVLSYQEDVMLVAQRMAGFSIAEANRLRKALGRSDTAERLAELVGRFLAGCSALGVDPATSELIWRMISSFAGYSFAKAHSASYAVVSMQCAWLKAHQPAVFLARVIANEGGFYRRSAYVEEARRLGIAILAPCVVCGVWATVGGGEGARERGSEGAREKTGAGSAPATRGWLRLGLHCVSGLSRATADALVAARAASPFAGIGDFLRRSGCSADEAQALLEAGAFDRLLSELTSAQRAWAVAVALRSRSAGRRPAPGQQTIAWAEVVASDPFPPLLPALAPQELAVRRYRRLGALPEQHPLGLWTLSRRPALRLVEITQEWHGRWIAVVGQIITRKDVNAVYEEDDGQRTADMAFATLEDETGLLETTWFPETWLRHGLLLGRDEPLLLSGRIEVDVGVCSLVVDGACAASGFAASEGARERGSEVSSIR